MSGAEPGSARRETDISGHISVVVAVKHGKVIDRVLAALEPQVETSRAPVFVPAAGGALADALSQRFTWLRVLTMPADATVPAMRKHGAEAAETTFVAMLEERCVPSPAWLNHAVEGLRGGCDVVGGPVAPGAFRGTADWACYLVEYHRYMPGVKRCGDVATANSVYRRSALLAHSALLERGYWETSTHAAMRAAGARFGHSAAMVVYKNGPFDFAQYLRERFWLSRATAGAWGQSGETAKVLLHAVAAPALPLLLTGRVATDVLRSRSQLGRFLAASPYVLAATVAAAAGELAGCLAGPGDGLSRVR